MARNNKITASEAEKLMAEPLGLKITEYPNGCVTSVAAFSCDYIRRVLLLDEDLGASPQERKQKLESGGLVIKSNIDMRMQKAANSAVKKTVSGKDKAIGALALVEPGTGKVRALAQSRKMGRDKKKGESYINFTVPRAYGDSGGFPAGSTFKMFTVAAALKKGIDVGQTYNSPKSMTVPSGTYFDCEGGGTGPWKVSNSTSSGRKNMYTGTRESVNTYFAQLEKSTGLCNTVKAAEAMGIKVPFPVKGKGINNQVPSFTLGVTDVSPLDMASAYATPASGGEYCEPMPIASIVDSNGKVLKKYEKQCEQVMDKDDAAQINDILKGLQQPGGFGYNNGTGLDIPSAAKTGTTQDNKAVWYTGYTPELSTAAMIAGVKSNGSPRSLSGVTINGRPLNFASVGGSSLAGPMWKLAMGKIQQYLTPENFDKPPKGQPVAQRAPSKKKSGGGDDDDKPKKPRGRGGDDDD